MRYVLVFLACLVLVLAGCQPMPIAAPAALRPRMHWRKRLQEAEAGEEVTEAMSAEEKIANAMSAGPSSISADAAILDWPSEAGGELMELRAGTNGWTCYPDDPATPVNDPNLCRPCVGGVVQGVRCRRRPSGHLDWLFLICCKGALWWITMIPRAKPAAGQEWQIDPPHVMVVSPEPWDPALFTMIITQVGRG